MSYDNIEILDAICHLLNLFFLMTWFWINRNLIYTIFIDMGIFTVHSIIYLKTHMDIKYTLYIQPFIEKNINNMFELLYSNKEYNPEDMVNIIIVFKNNEIIEWKEKWDNISNNDIVKYDNDDKVFDDVNNERIKCVIIEKYEKKTDKYNGIIYENYNDYLSFINHEKEFIYEYESSDVEFMTINVTVNENNYFINLSGPINYYMIGNNILEPWFIKYYLKKMYDYEINIDVDDYNVYIMDQNVNEIIIDKNKFITLGKSSYNVNKIIDDDIHSPSEESE